MNSALGEFFLGRNWWGGWEVRVVGLVGLEGKGWVWVLFGKGGRVCWELVERAREKEGEEEEEGEGEGERERGREGERERGREGEGERERGRGRGRGREGEGEGEL